MKLLQIIILELRSLVRSKTMAMLTVASVAWMFALPHLVKSDGTGAGARELYVHYSLGGVFLLLVIALTASAAGSLASERAAKRLQLTMVRPVRYWAVAWGRIVAQTAVGAAVLALTLVVLLCRVDTDRSCSHVLAPVLPSPREEAKAMYESYMNDHDTPIEVKRAKKSVVLRLLTQRAVDHYQTIPTNSTVVWKFRVPATAESAAGSAVRLRFTNQFEMRQEVRGEFVFGGATTVVSNITQAVLVIPLKARDGQMPEMVELSFRNDGKTPLMLRPRRDVNLLLPADGFVANAVRTWVELVSILALLVAFATLLSAGLGRSVAVFTVFVTLIVGMVSPSVIEQYPDELETKRIDRIGLAITRAAAEVTRPVAALAPLAAFAQDECVETDQVVRLVVIDLVAAPLLLALMAALVLPRKQEET